MGASGLTTATELVYLAEVIPSPRTLRSCVAHFMVVEELRAATHRRLSSERIIAYESERTSDFILQFTQPMDPTSVQNPNNSWNDIDLRPNQSR